MSYRSARAAPLRQTDKTAATSAALLLIAATAGVPNAEAGKYYFEAGAGAGKISNTAPLYGTAATPGFNFTWNLGVAVNLMHQLAPIQIHLGAKFRNIVGRDGNDYFGLQTIAPLIRIETPRFYVGGSVTPLARYSVEAGAPRNLIDYDSSVGALAFTAEAGLLWRVVPYFHFAFEGSATMVRGPNGIGPYPVLEITAQLRFYIDDFGSSSGAGGSGGHKGYDGWRYPFGLPK